MLYSYILNDKLSQKISFWILEYVYWPFLNKKLYITLYQS